MSVSVPLFRQEALQHQRARWLGEVLLVRPVALLIYTTIAVTGATALIAMLFLGVYTRHTTVAGQLVPSTGLVKVHAPQGGIVLRKHVVEDQRVAQGDLLYVLTTERQDGSFNDVQAAISREVQWRKRSLQEELAKTRQLHREERTALADKIASLQVEREKIAAQIDIQQARLKIATDTLARYRELKAQGYVPALQTQEREDALLDQQTRVQALERELMGLDRQLQALRAESSSLPGRHQAQVAQLERGISSMGQEWVESESRRQISIHAPQAGIVTALSGEPGQAADASRPLLALIPEGARLQAHLYAPSRAVGFIRPGGEVRVRYPAYPYQKFGHHLGQVLSVSRVALGAQELPSAAVVGMGTAGPSEPLYRIVVELAAQDILAYGKPQALQAGMALEADIVQETRRLYEWVLEPLYSLSGKL